MSIQLPTQKIKAATVSPKNIIIFAKPKIGKTEALAGLENNLILDLENGSDYIEALKIKVSSVKELKEVGAEILKAGCPYDYISIDSVTALEEMCVNYAEVLYSKKLVGKNWFKCDANKKLTADSGKMQYGNILNLPSGGGYIFLREAVTEIINYVKTLAPRTILICHVKDVLLEKAGGEFTAADLDLSGKIKRILSSQSDAIGYLYRKGVNQNYLSFVTSDSVGCGTRAKHLSNQEILLSEMTDKGLVTYWDKIFID